MPELTESAACQGPEEAVAENPVDLGQVVETLSGLSLPIEVGSLEIDDLGSLARRGLDRPLQFTVTYGGFTYDCRLDVGDVAEVTMAVTLGRLPFTAESPWGRGLLLRLLDRAGDLPSGRLYLSEDGEIRLAVGKPPPQPCVTVNVMATIAALLLEVRHYATMLHYLFPSDAPSDAVGDAA